jgi:hypothetical protein
VYGVPNDLPLERFVGQNLNQISLGRFQEQLRFSKGDLICVEGHWELRDAEGIVVDQKQEHERRECYRLHKILDLRVVGFDIDAPRSFSILFDSAYRLTVFDSSKEFESFQLYLKGGGEVVV